MASKPSQTSRRRGVSPIMSCRVPPMETRWAVAIRSTEAWRFFVVGAGVFMGWQNRSWCTRGPTRALRLGGDVVGTLMKVGFGSKELSRFVRIEKNG